MNEENNKNVLGRLKYSESKQTLLVPRCEETHGGEVLSTT